MIKKKFDQQKFDQKNIFDYKYIFDQKTLWPTNICDQTKFDQQNIFNKKNWSTKNIVDHKKNWSKKLSNLIFLQLIWGLLEKFYKCYKAS